MICFWILHFSSAGTKRFMIVSSKVSGSQLIRVFFAADHWSDYLMTVFVQRSLHICFLVSFYFVSFFRDFSTAMSLQRQYCTHAYIYYYSVFCVYICVYSTSNAYMFCECLVLLPVVTTISTVDFFFFLAIFQCRVKFINYALYFCQNSNSCSVV